MTKKQTEIPTVNPPFEAKLATKKEPNYAKIGGLCLLGALVLVALWLSPMAVLLTIGAIAGAVLLYINELLTWLYNKMLSKKKA